jgi:hypothetical protein
MHDINHPAEAREAIAAAEEGASLLDLKDAPLFYAQLAAAHASLAVYDATLALRDEVEATPSRLRKIRDGN